MRFVDDGLPNAAIARAIVGGRVFDAVFRLPMRVISSPAQRIVRTSLARARPRRCSRRATPTRALQQRTPRIAVRVTQHPYPLGWRPTPAAPGCVTRIGRSRQDHVMARPRLDADDLAAAYERDARRLLVFFTRRTYDAQLAVDLVGETYARAFELRRRFAGDRADSRRARRVGLRDRAQRPQRGAAPGRGRASRAAPCRRAVARARRRGACPDRGARGAGRAACGRRGRARGAGRRAARRSAPAGRRGARLCRAWRAGSGSASKPRERGCRAACGRWRPRSTGSAPRRRRRRERSAPVPCVPARRGRQRPRVWAARATACVPASRGCRGPRRDPGARSRRDPRRPRARPAHVLASAAAPLAARRLAAQRAARAGDARARADRARDP